MKKDIVVSEDVFYSLSFDYVEVFFQQYQEDLQFVFEDFCEYFCVNLMNGSVQFGLLFILWLLFGSVLVGNGVYVLQSSNGSGVVQLQYVVDEMVCNFCIFGYLLVQLNLLFFVEFELCLQLSNFGFGGEDFECMILMVNFLGVDYIMVFEFYECLKCIYCELIGVEFMYINDFEVCGWLQECMEVIQN